MQSALCHLHKAVFWGHKRSVRALAQAGADINTIRTRADLGPTGAVTADEMLLAIEQERRVEFAFEGHRWFDLVRTGRALEVLPNVTRANQTLFPIPADEILTNNSPEMIQNPGY